jgi:predicted transcriptional regulator
MQHDRTTLLSVRPRFAEALLAGTKTVEIRRRRAHIADGSLCLLYASSPVRALVGAVRVRRTDTDSPDALWSRWGDEAGLTRHEFDAYLDGSTLPCAIVVGAAARLPYPIGLDELRRRQDEFVTPQSYRFLRAGELASLTNGQARQLDRLAVAGA